MTDRWDMRVAVQSGETEKLTAIFDGLRVDRMALAADAVEIYSDRRDTNGDLLPDLVADADRGTGQIICNVQRYNPTPAQLAAVPAIQDKTKTTVNGVVPVLSPIGLDNTISECVPFNIMGHGQITPAAADYITTPKWGESVVEQDFAELLVRGELTDGWGAGPLSLATGLTYREQSFHDGAYPVEIDELGPPFNATNLGIRGIPSTFSTGSPNLHQFSTVSAISGGYDVWEAFGEVNVPIWQWESGQRLGMSFAYRSSDYSSVGRFDSWKAGLDFQIFSDLRFRATESRDVREATFTERFDNAPAGGSVLDPARNRGAIDGHDHDGRQSEPGSGVGRHHGLSGSSINRAGPRACACRWTATTSTSPTRSRRSARSASSTSATPTTSSASTCFATILAC